MIYLYGASGHGKVVIEIAEILDLPIAGLVDANPAICKLLGYPVSTELPVGENARFVISIGNNRARKKIATELKAIQFETLIHPNSNVSRRASIGKGTVLMAGVTINAETAIGIHCIINTNASVDHDCIIGDSVHISPNAALAGNVTVGEGTHIGIGACIIQDVTIGKWCTIGAGTVVLGDIPEGTTVVGNPGRIIKQINTQ